MFVVAALYARVAMGRWLEVGFVSSGNVMADAIAARAGCFGSFEGGTWADSVWQVGVSGHRGGSTARGAVGLCIEAAH